MTGLLLDPIPENPSARIHELIPAGFLEGIGAAARDPVLQPFLKLGATQDEIAGESGVVRPTDLVPRRRGRLPRLGEPEVIDADRLSPVEAPESLNDEFGHLGLKFKKPTRRRVAEILAREAREERIRQDILNRSPGGVAFTGLSLVAALGAAVVDPLNVASAFIPVAREGRIAGLIARIGSRTGQRVARGAIEGAVGNALIEPATLALSRAQQRDYEFSDALLNVALGAGVGAIGHTAFGRVADMIRSRPVEVRETAARIAIAQFAEGRTVDVESVLRRDLLGTTSLTRFDPDDAVRAALDDGPPAAGASDAAATAARRNAAARAGTETDRIAGLGVRRAAAVEDLTEARARLETFDRLESGEIDLPAFLQAEGRDVAAIQRLGRINRELGRKINNRRRRELEAERARLLEQLGDDAALTTREGALATRPADLPERIERLERELEGIDQASARAGNQRRQQLDAAAADRPGAQRGEDDPAAASPADPPAADDFVQKAREDFAANRWGRDADMTERAIRENVGDEAADSYRAEIDRLVERAVAERMAEPRAVDRAREVAAAERSAARQQGADPAAAEAAERVVRNAPADWNGQAARAEADRVATETGVEQAARSLGAAATPIGRRIREFVARALKQPQPARRERQDFLVVARLDDDVARQAEGILRPQGVTVDLNGFRVVLTEDEIRHIMRQHGTPETELPRGQVPLSEDDFAALPRIIEAPDRVERPTGPAAQEIGSEPAVQFVSEMNGETFVILVARASARAVRRGASRLQIMTMYKRKGGGGPTEVMPNPRTGDTSQRVTASDQNVAPGDENFNLAPEAAAEADFEAALLDDLRGLLGEDDIRMIREIDAFVARAEDFGRAARAAASCMVRS